jgi:hypothetical protein
MGACGLLAIRRTNFSRTQSGLFRERIGDFSRKSPDSRLVAPPQLGTRAEAGCEANGLHESSGKPGFLTWGSMAGAFYFMTFCAILPHLTKSHKVKSQELAIMWVIPPGLRKSKQQSGCSKVEQVGFLSEFSAVSQSDRMCVLILL